MSLSRAFVRAREAPECGSFATLLPKVEEAKPELRQVRGRTAETLEKLREVALTEGREAGYHEGFAEGQQEAFEATRLAHEAGVVAFRIALDEQAARVEDRVQEWYREAEVGLAALATAVAARVIGREISQSPEVVIQIAREALQAISAVDKVRIRVNPFDAPILEKKKALILAANPTVRGVEIVDDPAIEGGAKIESDAGLIDATVRTQLELAFDSLRRAA